MKAVKTLAKILSAAMVLSIVFAFSACNLLQGSLKLESFTVDRSSIKTVYYLGEEIDFSEIRATVKYSDNTLNTEYTYYDLTISYDADITATVGTKTVTVSFTDPHLEVVQTTTVQITVKEDPNAPKHKDYVIDSSAMKTTYLIGDDLDFTGVTAKETFTNGGADVALDASKLEYVYADDITATAGTKVIVVKYEGKDAGSISITVNNPAITSLELDTTGVTLNYMVGDTVSFDGLKANVTYENGETATITDFEFVTDLDTLTAEYGTKQVTVKINDALSATVRNTSFEIKVDGIVDYDIVTTGMTLTYLENETVSFAGIKVTANYYYGSTADVAFEDLTFVHVDDLSATVGAKTVTVKVGDEDIGNFIVTIGDIPAASANTTGVDLSYRVGETVSLDGLTVTLTFSDGNDPQTIALADLEVVTTLTGLTTTAGKKDIQVKYPFDEYYVYAQFQITVYGVDSYVIDASAMKTTYIVGDTLDYTGLVVKAHYLDGGEDVVIDASKLSFTDTGITASAGNKTIPVLVDNKSANVNISVTVEKNSITSTVVGGTFDQSYETGEEVNFTGLTVTVTYKNGDTATLTLADDLGFSVVDMTTAGEKTVTVSFKDAKNNNEAASTTFKINVVNGDVVSAFAKPEDLVAFESANSSAGKTAYKNESGTVNGGFSSEFANGNMTYVIGDDNAFNFVPTFAINSNDVDKYLDYFYSDVDIYVHNGTDYVKLDKETGSVTEYTYKLNGEVIATVDTYYGTYQFTKPIDKIKISVMPSADYYAETENFTPVVLEAKVIDAYNVYTAKELSVIDNFDGRTDWNTFKLENGLSGINPAGIVLHNDIKLTYEDVPSSFFYHSDAEIQYYNYETEDIKVYKESAGMNYLKDETSIYIHHGPSEFTIQGNFFTINADDFPLVASPSIFGEDSDKGYGGDYSNACLFMFQTINDDYIPASAVTDVSHVTIENIAFRGNAGRDSWTVQKVDGEEVTSSTTELVTAGGLIMIKSSRHADTTLNNVINHCFFITYFPEYEAKMTVNNSKCFDSYQNGAYVWADSSLALNNTYINGTGGPVIMAQSVKPNGGDVYYNPVVTVVGGDADTHLVGDEAWFKAVGATAVIPSLKALGGGVNTMLNSATQNSVGGNWVENDKMNIKVALMTDGGNADEALRDGFIQGIALFDGQGIERWYDPTSENYSEDWVKIMTHAGFAQGKPFITVYDADGNAYTLYFSEADNMFYDLNDKALGTDASHTELIAAFASADEIVLHQGGLSILFEFYH